MRLERRSGLADFAEKDRYIFDQPLPLLIVRPVEAGIGFGIGVIDRAAEIDETADHTDTGAVAEDIVRILGVDAADHGDAAAVELGKGVAGGAENPEFGSGVVRVPLGHGQTAGADRAADVHLAVGHGVAGAVGGVAEDGDFGADIEITDIVGGRALAEDGGARHAHAAETLAGGTIDLQMQAALALQSDADIVLAIGFEDEGWRLGRSLPHQLFKFHGADALALFVETFYNSCRHCRLLVSVPGRMGLMPGV